MLESGQLLYQPRKNTRGVKTQRYVGLFSYSKLNRTPKKAPRKYPL
jgi:hypothetical protein